MKKTFLLFFLLLVVNNTLILGQDNITTIVIDAGHGGKDPGCLGKNSKEKDIVLSVALKLGKLIETNYQNINVIYTRKTDVFIELFQRAAIANKNNANLFISIHCNSNDNKNAHGIETFVTGLGRSEANLLVAKKENSSILLEKNYENNYEGYNPDSPEANIIFSLFSSSYMSNSALLAQKVQNNLVKNTNRFDRTVKQAGFLVLYKVAMPSILIELGFLSNEEEEKHLTNNKEQDIMAVSICNAIIEYKNKRENTALPLLSLSEKPNDKNTDIKPETVSNNINNTQNKETDDKRLDKPIATNNTQNKETDDKRLDKPIATNNTQNKDYNYSKGNKPNVYFCVQFYLSKEKLSATNAIFKDIKDFNCYYQAPYWKYTSGNTTSYSEILEIQKELKKRFPDCFLIGFSNNQRITLEEAKELLYFKN